jgi:hypothetical protein
MADELADLRAAIDARDQLEVDLRLGESLGCFLDVTDAGYRIR